MISVLALLVLNLEDQPRRWASPLVCRCAINVGGCFYKFHGFLLPRPNISCALFG